MRSMTYGWRFRLLWTRPLQGGRVAQTGSRHAEHDLRNGGRFEVSLRAVVVRPSNVRYFQPFAYLASCPEPPIHEFVCRVRKEYDCDSNFASNRSSDPREKRSTTARCA